MLGVIAKPFLAIDPTAVDFERNTKTDGAIHTIWGTRLWTKRAIGIGLIGLAVAALLLYFNIIPNNFSHTQRLIALASIGGAAALYNSCLALRNIQSRSVTHDFISLGWRAGVRLDRIYTTDAKTNWGFTEKKKSTSIFNDSD